MVPRSHDGGSTERDGGVSHNVSDPTGSKDLLSCVLLCGSWCWNGSVNFMSCKQY
jgi:hypothetical protein